jgi:hypothetical protein
MERNYYYFLDKEGRIWHQGTEITDPRFVYLVHRGMKKVDNGYLVKCQGENCYFEVEDAPYVVQDVALHKNQEGRLQQIDLIFPGGYTEVLNPSSLRVTKDNVLYTRVRSGEFDARFTLKSFFHLSPYFEQDANGSEYSLAVSGKKYIIAQPA